MTLDDYKAEQLARIYAKRDETAERQKRESAADQLAHLRGELDAGEYANRAQERIATLAKYDLDGEAMKKAMARAERSHEQAERRLRWNSLYNKYHILFPLYRDLDLTKMERAVLIGFMLSGRGERSFECAKKWIAAKAGTTTKSVQRTLHRLAAHDLIHIKERRLKGKAMNLWNVYTVKCEKILAWVKYHIITIKGDKKDSHPQGGLYLVSTDGETQEGLDLQEPKKEYCRQKAKHYEEFGAGVGLSSEDFVIVATGAMRELNISLPDEPSEAQIIETIERYRAERNPGYKPFFWDKGVRKHGLRRALLAVLCTHLTKEMRLAPIPDKRPWNERETVKCPNRFLSGILKRDISGPNACRPEVTIGSKLLDAQIYELPVDLIRAVRKRGRERKGLKRYQTSAA